MDKSKVLVSYEEFEGHAQVRMRGGLGDIMHAVVVLLTSAAERGSMPFSDIKPVMGMLLDLEEAKGAMDIQRALEVSTAMTAFMESKASTEIEGHSLAAAFHKGKRPTGM